MGLARNIKESIFIGVNNTTLNRNIDKFNLPHIWDRVLLNTPGLTLKRHAQAVGHANSNQHNTLTQLNQPMLPTHLGQPNSSMQFSQFLSMLSEPLGTHKRHSISVPLRPDEVQLLAGWKFVFNNQCSVPENLPTPHCIYILFAQDKTCSPVISLVSFIIVSSFIISTVIVWTLYHIT